MRRLTAPQAVLLVLPLLALPLLLSALSTGEVGRYRYPAEPSRTARLVIVTPQQKSIQDEFEEGFRRWLFEHDGVGVELEWQVHGGGSTSLAWIQEQFLRRPDGIGVDLFFGGGIDPYEALKSSGLLERYDPSAEVLDGVPLELAGFPIVDPDRQWFGSTLTGFGIMVNQRVVDLIGSLRGVVIEDWEDLADPRLRSWVGASDPRTSSSSHMCFEILLQAYGHDRGLELIRRIGGNARSFVKSSSEVPRLCAVGEVACGMTIDYYALAQIEKVGDVVRFVLPEGNTVVNADAAGILYGAPEPVIARRFIDYLLSEDAALLWMLKHGEVGGPRRQDLNRGAIRPGAYEAAVGRTNVHENPFRSEFRLRYDAGLANTRWMLLNDLIGALVIDTHSELVAALDALDAMDGPARTEAERVLFESPATEAELVAAAARWSESAFRERTCIEWTDFARAHYEKVIAMSATAREIPAPAGAPTRGAGR